MSDLLTPIATRLHAELRYDKRYHADCPFCGKEAKRGQKHFSFCEEGYFCHVCQEGGSLNKLARHLAIQPSADYRPVRPQRQQQPALPREWQHNPERYVQRFCEAPSRLHDWQSYKPLSLETIAKYRLGVGILPSSRVKQRRLIVPVYSKGQVVALHGRAYMPGDDEAKWLTAAGSRKDVLFNADALKPGTTVIICENMVDCLLAQEAADCVAVAAGGVSWREEFSQIIAASRPKHVIVWLDNDLVGQANAETHRLLIAEWRREMQARVAAGKIPRIPSPPERQGPKIANSLLSLGVKASLYQWPRGSAPKADIGSVVCSQITV